MRQAPLVLMLIAACGGNTKAVDSNTPSDTAPAIDASPAVACTPTSGTTVKVRKIGNAGGSALLATSPPGDSRLFVVVQDGLVRIFDHENLLPDPFLDINSLVTADAPPGERGLLGLAFHPSYATNGYFYVYYTTSNADVVDRFNVSATDPNVADPNSRQPILSIPDFASNHNGGMIEFGPDGYLYISDGDGGGAGDPNRTAQDPNALLGKIHRIDVDNPGSGKPYGIPGDNPFANGANGAPEVYLMGLRNPWRWSFDRATGDIWIGDVGQGAIEELDVIPAGTGAGKNFGWSMWEASSCYGNYTCTTTGMTFPQLERTHSGDGWLAIIGGQVYRGPCYPDLRGTYFFTDNVAHPLTAAHYDALGNTVTASDLPGSWPASPASLHADAAGELYETTTSGDIWHIEAGP